MNYEQFFKAILKDVKTDVTEEFDRNFERKAFFNNKWPHAKTPTTRGSLMMRSGALRRGNQSKISGDLIIFTNSMPYAGIHNQGGTITVTAKMRSFFWAMYYKASGKVKTKKDGTRSKSKAAERFSAEAEYWKSLALMKVGAKIKITKRQVIGSHPRVDGIIKEAFDRQMKDIEQQITKMLSQK